MYFVRFSFVALHIPIDILQIDHAIKTLIWWKSRPVLLIFLARLQMKFIEIVKDIMSGIYRSHDTPSTSSRFVRQIKANQIFMVIKS